jgi:hypothetical protein
LYATYTPAADMKAKKFKSYTITIKKAPVANEVYAIKLHFTNYAGAGDDNITVKYADAALGTYKIGKDTVEVNDASSLAEALRKTLNKNLKDPDPLATVAGNDANIIITEVDQPYEVGVKPFAVMPVSVEIVPLSDGTVDWATISESEPPYTDLTVNGKLIADMEWFYVGARGDMYRGFGHPYGVKTELVADITKDYDTIDIHYAYVGPNEGAQKSEKTITLAGTYDNLQKVCDLMIELGFKMRGKTDSASNTPVFPASAE